MELLTLHDLFPCGKGRRGLWRPVQERFEKDPDLVWTLFQKDIFYFAVHTLKQMFKNVNEMVIQSVTQVAQKESLNTPDRCQTYDHLLTSLEVLDVPLRNSRLMGAKAIETMHTNLYM